MNLRQLFLIAGGLCAVTTATAVAQTQPAGAAHRIQGRFSGMVGPGPALLPGGGDTFQFIAAGPAFGGQVVAGSPYSAEAVTETQQTLADGNKISRTDSSKIYRDSQGRTRREQTIRSLGPWASAGDPTELVFINDPVAGVNYVLNTRERTARKTEVRLETAVHTIEDAGAEKDVLRWEARETATATEGAGNAVYFRGVHREAAPGQKVEQHDVTVVHSGVGPGINFDGDNVWTEPLGKQMIEGVEAEGVRITTTIPAGQIGNDRPIEIVSESWHSAQLKTLVLSRHSDPRMGETTYRLTNIQLIEPLAAVFEVPPDYTIEEGGEAMFFERRIGPGNGTPADSPR